LILLAAMAVRNRWPDKVTSVPDDDPRMNAAMEKARTTLDSFIAALASPKPNQSDFAVKKAFADGDDVEVMWVSSVRYDGKVFRGRLSNEPRKVRTVRMGQSVEVPPSEIADWMYMEDGRFVGAYTLRVLRETLSPGERAAFDREVRFADE
jgi:uncharacterized protein YegJ (DUF2314 family)